MDNITADVNMYYMTVHFQIHNEIHSLQNHIAYDFSYRDYETLTDKQVR